MGFKKESGEGGVGVGMDEYERGFHDCILLLKYHVREKGEKGVSEFLDYLEAAVVEGRLEKIKMQLGIFRR
ncbi:MAG: hypothetical protein ACTSWP_10840 [Candidatus Freyarchaeota archaeon]